MNEPLVHEVALKCSVDHAFEVFTQRVDLWWPPAHRKFSNSVLKHAVHVGGQIVETAHTGERFVLADVLACDRPHQIILAWHPGKITQPTQTVVNFTARGSHETHVKVVHSEAGAGLGDAWGGRAALFNRGWQAVLTALENYIEQKGSRR